MSIKIKFGTDGWRAGIAHDYTFENVKRCAQGFANFLRENNEIGKWVVVGYDMRFLSEDFAKSVVEILCANDINVYLTTKATPTPIISYLVPLKNAVGAVNITASHNPPSDNGFKVRDKNGGAIAPDDLKRIENLIPDSLTEVKSIDFEDALSKNKVILVDPDNDYINHIQKLVDINAIKDAGLTVLVDAMWGNGSNWFTNILNGGKTKVFEIHNHRNPSFPEMSRPEPIPPNINVGLRKTVELNADVLIITDGDADRVGVGDENGNFINQLQVYALLAYYLLEVRKQKGPIVKTLSTTSMLNKLAKIYDVPIYETGVGFKYVAPKMIETNALIGGEESGGFAFRGNVPERDGILAGLFILDLMVKLKKKPTELINILYSIVGEHYYDRIDTKFEGDINTRKEIITRSNPKTLGGLQVINIDTSDGFKYSLEDGGWMLIRFSGTEPIIRVYCETTMKDRVKRILNDGLITAGIK
jgi:phosphomannomutase